MPLFIFLTGSLNVILEFKRRIEDSGGNFKGKNIKIPKLPIDFNKKVST